jgi:hypothetical protein
MILSNNNINSGYNDMTSTTANAMKLGATQKAEK